LNLTGEGRKGKDFGRLNSVAHYTKGFKSEGLEEEKKLRSAEEEKSRREGLGDRKPGEGGIVFTSGPPPERSSLRGKKGDSP